MLGVRCGEGCVYGELGGVVELFLGGYDFVFFDDFGEY